MVHGKSLQNGGHFDGRHWSVCWCGRFCTSMYL